MIRYFVSYAFGQANGSSLGFGWTEVSLRAPIRDGAGVYALQRDIEEQRRAPKVIILGWQRFDDGIGG